MAPSLQEEPLQGHVTGVCLSAEFSVSLFADGKPTGSVGFFARLAGQPPRLLQPGDEGLRSDVLNGVEAISIAS